MHPVELLKNFLEPSRLAVAGVLAARHPESASVDEMVERTGLARREVLEAVGALSACAVVSPSEDGYRLDVEVLRSTGRELAEVELPMDPVIGYGMTDDERRVLAQYFHGRTLYEVPGNRAKRLVVLERLALEFDVGTRYPETDVNTILGRYHPDWSSLRRHLVDEGFLDREQNVYWRSGGKVLEGLDHLDE